MKTFKGILLMAVLAGAISGVVATVAHQFITVPLIEKAEAYPAPPDAEPSPAGWEPAPGMERTLSTALADILMAIATALVLGAAYVIHGDQVDWRRGLHWGLGAFAVLTLWPNIGLPPYLPGQAMAPHIDRQIWWSITALMAVTGLTLLVFSRKVVPVLAGIVLLVLPQLFGAPLPKSYNSAIPPDLAHQFMVSSEMTNLLFWLSVGIASGALYKRFVLQAASERRVTAPAKAMRAAAAGD